MKIVRQEWDAASITQWSQEEFGAPSVEQVAQRMKKEIKEFYDDLEAGNLEGARKEIVDIEVMLRQCAELLGVDLDEGVDDKMNVNANRTWAKGEDGEYQHV